MAFLGKEIKLKCTAMIAPVFYISKMFGLLPICYGTSNSKNSGNGKFRLYMSIVC